MNSLRISTRLYLLVGLAVVIMGAIAMFAALGENSKLIAERKAMLAAMNENAVSVFAAYYQLETAGTLSRAEAQAQAITAVKAMRYQDSGYFWINDLNQTMIMHPIKPEMNGTDQSSLKDPTGKFLFVEMVNLVKAEGKGFVDYMWPKPGFEEPVQKYSHVHGFAPWGWLIGTGVYADDLAATFLDNAIIMAGVLALGIALLVGVAYAIVRSIVGPVGSLTRAMGRLADGDHEIAVPAVDRRDEIGRMAQAVQVFKDAAIEKLRIEAQSEEFRHTAEADRTRTEAEQVREAQEDQIAVSALGAGLASLAKGDLTHRIDAQFSAKTQKLKEDFNLAMSQLQETMSSVTGAVSALKTGSGEISQAADDLSRRTEQQAASLEETAAALDEITSTVKQTAEGARQATKVSNDAKAGAEKSSHVVRQAVQAMSQIEKSSEQIGQIIGVIDEIAFQTNLLALNAGVEAARAGEAGRGFAVVAQEVRALAQRSAEAAKEIKELISTSTDQVDQGVRLVGQTGEVLELIATQVTEMSALVEKISYSAQEQSTGLAQVNTAVNQMDQVTQQNAAMVEESTAASHSLAREAQLLAELVSRFKVTAGSDPVRQSAFAGKAVPTYQPAKPVAQLRSVGGRGQSAAAAAPATDPDGWEGF